MASKALAKAKEAFSKRATAMRKGFVRRAQTGAVYRHGAAAITGAAIAKADASGMQKSYFGVPWKLVLIAGSLAAEYFGKGTLQSVAGGVASGTIAIYTNRATASGSVIAGDDGDDV